MAEKLYLKNLFGDLTGIYIPQDHEGKTSHNLTGAVDFALARWVAAKIPLYAPCDLRLVYCPENKSGDSLENTNTLMFQSVNDVEFTDGSIDKLCISFAHMEGPEYTALKNYYSNKGKAWNNTLVINKGDLIYYAGKEGVSAIHVHIRFASGNYKTNESVWKTVSTNPKRVVLNTTGEPKLTCDEVFFLDRFTVLYNPENDSNGYPNALASHFNWQLSNEISAAPTTGFYLKANQLDFIVRSGLVFNSDNVPISAELTRVLVGSQATICEFLGKQADGYQWARVKYNGIEGYAQIDTKNAYLVTGTTKNPAYPLYLKANQLTFRIRKTLSFDSSNRPNGSYDDTVPVGGKAKILELLGKQVDGYQWARVNYNGQDGYAQVDTYNAYLLTF